MASEIIDELRRGSGSVRKQDKGRITLSFTVDYLVVTDDKRTTREEVLLGTTNAPIVGLNYGPLGVVCVGKNAERSETNPLYWTLTCEFDSGTEEQQQDPTQPNNPDPTTWISIWKIDINDDREETLYEDFTSPTALMYTNTAGELYEPLTTVKKSVVSWKFTQFEPPTTTLVDLSDRHMHVNSTAIRGFPARSLLMSVREAELGYYNGFYAWTVPYSVAYNKDLWVDKRFSAGYNCLDAGGKLQPYEVNGVQVFGPLKADGTRGVDAGPPESLDWSLAHEQTFLPYPEIDFNTFIRSIP
jgi:hypothetical protein